jgi:hypothetical protein
VVNWQNSHIRHREGFIDLVPQTFFRLLCYGAYRRLSQAAFGLPVGDVWRGAGRVDTIGDGRVDAPDDGAGTAAH